VGVGSLFWIELELTAAPQTTLGAGPPLPVPPGDINADAPSCTVLYVEDNPANLILVEEIIARRPYIRLLSAVDGRSGIELARQALPDVILMDINLPGMSGITALGILSKDLVTAHIPVVALSANAIPRDIENGLAAGFYGYLTKPIQVGQFLETLDKALKFASQQTAYSLQNEQENHVAQ
jgi:CheY-like chemotaxis protein